VAHDADHGRPIEAFADMTKSRALGFQGFRRTDDTFRADFRQPQSGQDRSLIST